MQGRKSHNKNKEQMHSRHQYEDPSRKFVDWVNRLGWEKTFFGRTLLFLEEKFQIRMIVVLLLYSFLLAFSLSFEIEAPIELKLGDIAPVNIISPLTFQWTDEVTTEEKRTRAEEKVLPVFDFDATVEDKVIANTSRAFRQMRNYIRSLNTNKKSVIYDELMSAKTEFEKNLGVSIPDYLYDWLSKELFNPKIESMLVRTLDGWFDNKIADSPDRFIPEGYQELSLVYMQRQGKSRELTIDKRDIIDIQSDFNFNLKDIKGLDRFNIEDKEILFSLAKSLMYPNVTPNKKETASRKLQAREAIMPVQITIKKNQPVVVQGSIIQPSHIALFKEIQAHKAERHRDFTSLVLGCLFVTLMILFWTYTQRYTLNRVKFQIKDLQVMGLILLGEVMITKLFLFMTEEAFGGKFGAMVPSGFFIFLSPVAAGPMLVGLLLTSGEIVFMFTLFLALVMGIMLEMNFAFSLVVLAGGLAAARGVFTCKARNDIYWAGIRTGAVNAVVIGLILILERGDSPTLLRDLLLIMPAGFISGIFSAMISLIFVSLLESVFNYTTDVKLLELSNLNHPILKEMIVKAPGTYHHSMMVGSMVEAAAEEIGANPLLSKVMAYYHDIGKLEHSGYFIENQKPGNNPHDHISPFMSRTLLIAHVKDGVEMGMKYKLGKPIIDGILQHHGTTVISYFYNKALDMADDDSPEISEDEFRYPGPKPQFREAALCMLADSIEAAARSLDEPTPVRLQNIVKNIIQKKFMDGQLDDCNLTLKDLTKVEAAFIRILLGIYHQRIDYPKSAGGGLGDMTPKVLNMPRGNR